MTKQQLLRRRAGYSNYNEPHIWFEDGIWHVCACLPPVDDVKRALFTLAYRYVSNLNRQLQLDCKAKIFYKYREIKS